MEIPKPIELLYAELLQRLNSQTSYIKTKYEVFVDRLRFNYGTILTIGARPGHGKTTFRNALLWDIIQSNPDKWINIVDFQLDMDPVSLFEKDMKRLNIKIEKPTKRIYSSEEEAKRETNNVEQKIKNLLKNTNWQIISSIADIKALEGWVDTLLSEMIKNKPSHMEAINIVTLDFALMVPSNKERGLDIVSLMHTFQRIRNKYKALCIVLTQLNREVNEKSRLKEGTYGNRIMDRDFYGSDAFMQYSDLVVAIDVPFSRGITLWSEKQIPVDEKMVVINVIKDRITGTLDSYIYLKDNLDFKFYNRIDDINDTTIEPIHSIDDDTDEENDNNEDIKILDIQDQIDQDLQF